MKRHYKLPFALTLLASTGVLLAACGNSEPEEPVLENWDFQPLAEEKRNERVDNDAFEFTLKRLNTLNRAIQTAADAEAFEAENALAEGSGLGSGGKQVKAIQTFVVNGHTFEVSPEENGFYTTRLLDGEERIAVQLEADGLSPALDEEGNPIPISEGTADEATRGNTAAEESRPASQPMTRDEQFRLGVDFLWLAVEDYIHQNPKTDTLTETKEALRVYLDTIQPALQQLKLLKDTPGSANEHLVLLQDAWEELARVYHEERGNLVNGKKPKYSWEGKVVAAFADEKQTEIVPLHTDYIEGYEQGTSLSVEQVNQAVARMAEAGYEIGKDSDKGQGKETGIVKDVSIAIGPDGSLTLTEPGQADTPAERERQQARQAEQKEWRRTLTRAESDLYVLEGLAVWMPDGKTIVFLETIRQVVPEFAAGETLTDAQWGEVLEAGRNTAQADQAAGPDRVVTKPETDGSSGSPDRNTSRDSTEREAERAAAAKQRELEQAAKNQAREREREQTAQAREEEKARKEAEKEQLAQVKLAYENRVLLEKRNFDALYAEENSHKAFTTKDKKYLRLRDKVLNEDYQLALYTSAYAVDGYDARELGRLRDHALKLEDAIATYREGEEMPERFAASDAAFQAYVANREQILPGYLQSAIGGDVSAYAQDFGTVLAPLGGYSMDSLMEALRRENPSAVSSFGSVYVDGLYRKYFREMGWL